jgi:hypothetical protein
MRALTPVLALVLVLLSGCVYKAPVTTNHTIPVNPAVLGVWQAVPEPGKDLDADERMLVLKYSGVKPILSWKYPRLVS